MIAFKSLHINVIQNSLSKFMEIKDNVLKQHILKFTHKFEVFENFMEKKMLRIFLNKSSLFVSHRERVREIFPLMVYTPTGCNHRDWVRTKAGGTCFFYAF